MDKGRLQIFQILDFLEKPKSVFFRQEGEVSPSLQRQAAPKMPLQAASFSSLCCLFRYPLMWGAPHNAPAMFAKKNSAATSKNFLS